MRKKGVGIIVAMAIVAACTTTSNNQIIEKGDLDNLNRKNGIWAVLEGKDTLEQGAYKGGLNTGIWKYHTEGGVLKISWKKWELSPISLSTPEQYNLIHKDSFSLMFEDTVDHSRLIYSKLSPSTYGTVDEYKRELLENFRLYELKQYKDSLLRSESDSFLLTLAVVKAAETQWIFDLLVKRSGFGMVNFTFTGKTNSLLQVYTFRDFIFSTFYDQSLLVNPYAIVMQDASELEVPIKYFIKIFYEN